MTLMTRLVTRVLFALGAVLLPLAAMAEWASVSTRQVNVRSAPGASAAVEYQAWIYSPLKVLAKKGDWVKVSDFQNDMGWAYAPALSNAPAVVVKTAKANIRSGPGPKSKVVWEVERGYPFLLLERIWAWLHVKDDEEIDGWIHRSMVWGNLAATQGQ